MQRTKRSLNDHKTHLTSQVTDSMMPPKGKLAKKLQRAGEEAQEVGGGYSDTSIYT